MKRTKTPEQPQYTQVHTRIDTDIYNTIQRASTATGISKSVIIRAIFEQARDYDVLMARLPNWIGFHHLPQSKKKG